MLREEINTTKCDIGRKFMVEGATTASQEEKEQRTTEHTQGWQSLHTDLEVPVTSHWSVSNTGKQI